MTTTRPWPSPTLSRPWTVPELGATTLHHVSDTHFGYRPWSYAEGGHMLADLEAGLIPPVDAFVHTGDITDHSLQDEDAYSLGWLAGAAKGAPGIWAPGNHDLYNTRSSSAEWQADYGRPANTYLDVGGYRLVAFAPDTWAEHTDWTISAATWSWLDSAIGATSDPVILLNHYPPWELGLTQGVTVQPHASLAGLVDAHSNIEGMLVGHMHWRIEDARSCSFVVMGGRQVPVLMGVSQAFTDSDLSRDQSAQYPSISTYVSLYPGEMWEVRYRLHGPRAWGGPGGYRMTTLNLHTGLVSKS